MALAGTPALAAADLDTWLKVAGLAVAAVGAVVAVTIGVLQIPKHRRDRRAAVAADKADRERKAAETRRSAAADARQREDDLRSSRPAVFVGARARYTTPGVEIDGHLQHLHCAATIIDVDGDEVTVRLEPDQRTGRMPTILVPGNSWTVGTERNLSEDTDTAMIPKDWLHSPFIEHEVIGWKVWHSGGSTLQRWRASRSARLTLTDGRRGWRRKSRTSSKR